MELILLELQPTLSMLRRKEKAYLIDGGKTLLLDGRKRRNEH